MRNIKGTVCEHQRGGSRSLRAMAEDEKDGPAADVSRRGGPSSMDGVTGFMGLKWDDPETVRVEIRPDLINRGGLLSGVVTYAMVDYAMGSSLWAQTSEAEHIATINIAINYVQTATAGEIICRARVERRNRSIAVLSAEVRHDDGRLLVSAIGSYSIFPARARLAPAPATT
jgi:acyl-CoA thioesterase